MLTLVVLAAGKGTRMRSELPKVLHPLLGMPLIEYAFEKGDALGVDRLVAVIGHGRERIQAQYDDRDVVWAIQDQQLGTGHAAHVGVEAFFASVDDEGADDADVLIVNGDLPVLDPDTLRAMVAHHDDCGADLTVMTCDKGDYPFGFGRIVRGVDGEFQDIVEESDADEQTRTIPEVNVGTYLFKAGVFREFYQKIGTDNEQGEYYLTDVVVETARAGRKVETFEVEDEEETAQVNSQRELAEVTALLRERMVAWYLESGVKIDDPSSVYIERGVTIAPGAHLAPFCVLRRGVEIGPGCEVGPFAHLRPGTTLEDGASVGNFVEVKNSTLGKDSKARHLTYIGDGDVGADVNVGAGTIFANYDGNKKHRTVVKDRAFIGSGTILVAPVTVGTEASTGAGAVVLRNRDVADGDVAVGVPARSLKSTREK